MTEDEAKKWVKNKVNQQKVIAECIGDNPHTSKLAIFMAGVPGAGKTEFVRGLQDSRPGVFTIIEHDRLVEYIETYSPEHYYNYRKAGSTLVTAAFDHCLKNGYSFVFDGTLSHDNGLKNIGKTLKQGYSVVVIYIHQDVQSAWKLTQDRELVKKRAIEKEGFIETCKKINANLRKVFVTFAEDKSFAFWIIKKNGAPGMENATTVLYDGPDGKERSDIEAILETDYNVSQLEV